MSVATKKDINWYNYTEEIQKCVPNAYLHLTLCELIAKVWWQSRTTRTLSGHLHLPVPRKHQ